MTDPTLTFATQSEWEAWLEGHGSTSSSVWLRVAKKSAEQPTVTCAQALESALCHGWIDGQKRSEDQHYWLQRFTPRTARASGQRSTGKKPRRSSMPTKCDQPASPPSNGPSRTDDGVRLTRQRARLQSPTTCNRPWMPTPKPRRFLPRSIAKTGLPSCFAFKASRRPRHAHEKSLNLFRC